MTELETIRSKIDCIDSELVSLFEKRMVLSRLASAYKREHGIPITDEAREKDVVEHCISILQDTSLITPLCSFISCMIMLSRQEQEKEYKEVSPDA